MDQRKFWIWFLLLELMLGILLGAQAQESVARQLWGNVVLGFPQNRKLYLELDFEPKGQIFGEQQWGNLDTTPLVEYYPNRWVDVTAECVLGWTRQTNQLRTLEASPRVGLRLHILGSLWGYVFTGERVPLSRFSLSTFLRYEYRNLWYNQGLPAEHQSRVRVRLETRLAINNFTIRVDKTYYLFADAEKYFNIGEGVHEVFSSKFRLRIGPGYRASYRHRFEILFIYDFARNTVNDKASKDAMAIDLRYKLYF